MDLSVLIHSFDKYKFLWKGCHYCFKKYWDFNTPVDIYFANECVDISFSGFKQIKTGKGEWGFRMLKALDAIPTKHVLYIQEDMWLARKISCNEITMLMNDFIELNMQSLKFVGESDRTSRHFSKTKVKGRYHRINTDSWYLGDHMPAIWITDYIKRNILPEHTPWLNVGYANQTIRKHDDKPRHYRWPAKLVHGVHCSKKATDYGPHRIFGYGTKILNEMKRNNASII